MRDLLAKARARVVRHLVLDKGAFAVTIGMGGLVALLLTGTQILNWYWPVLLAMASLGVGLYQLRRHIPSRYRLAQGIDQRMHLADALSTAVYFSEHPPRGLEQVCALQFQAAERLAVGVNVEQAVPLRRPRYLVPATVLLAAASALFVVRYVMIGKLDMNPSLLALAGDNFFTSPPDSDPKAPKLNLRSSVLDPSQPPDPNGEQPTIILPPDAEKSAPLVSQEDAAQQGSGEKSKGKADQKGDEKGSGSDEKTPDSGKQGGDQSQHEGEDKGKQPQDGEDRRSMLDKLRDTVSNLMNKMNSSQGDPKDGKAPDKQNAKQDGKQGKGDDQNQQSQSDLQQDSDKQGDAGKQQDAKQSQAPGQPSSDKQNGAGRNEGKKDLAEAKAEEAMGKVSELLGQRASQIKGDVMVEVTTTSQTLRTASMDQKAGHTDAGGEVHRDQVPLADQAFVERYFEEIRKASAPAPKVNNTGKAKAPVGSPAPAAGNKN